MKSTYKVIITLLIVGIVALLSSNLYLWNTTNKKEVKLKDLQEKFDYLDAYKEIIKYDLETSRDSVRILYDLIPADTLKKLNKVYKYEIYK
jgi:hypothetical protein